MSSVEVAKAKEESKRSHWASLALFSALGVAAALVTAVALFPRWRQEVRSWFQGPYREVLATAEGVLTPQGPRVVVVKLKTNEGLLIEVFDSGQALDDRGSEGEKSEGSSAVIDHRDNLIAQIPLDERRDAFMSVQGDATNLSLVDFDGDGILEIMAPSYDENLVPRLNVFKYVPESRSFQRLGPASSN